MTPATLAPRCPRCAAPLERFGGELYCADCLSYTVGCQAPPPPAYWFVATSAGEYVESSTDLEHLLRVLREEIMSPGSEDVVIHAGPRVVAVVRGDALAVVPVR